MIKELYGIYFKQTFKDFVFSQAPDRPINHDRYDQGCSVWSGCAVGDYLAESASVSRYDYETYEGLDTLELVGDADIHELLNQATVHTYGQLQKEWDY